MGLLKWILKKCKCESKCAYNINDEYYDCSMLNTSLNNYKLKHKDLNKIYRILNKRELKCTKHKITEI